jgi:hypothetical protein
MAITVNQYPPQILNAANSDLHYVVTSNSSSKDNYSYVCDIIDTTDTRIVRLKQRPNASGIGVFNINDIAKTLVSGDYDLPESGDGSVFKPSDNNLVFYKVAFGEEWSNTPTSSIFLYNGITNTAISGSTNVAKLDPNHTLDPITYLFGATIDRTEQTYYFDYPSHYNPSATWDENLDKKLSDMPNTNIPLYKDRFHIFSMFDGQWASGSTVYRNDIAFMDVNEIDSTGQIINQQRLYNSRDAYGPNSPRALFNSTLASYSSSFFSSSYRNNRLINIGVGDPIWSNEFTLNSSSVSITIDLGSNFTSSWHFQYLQYDILDPPCDYPLYQLAWLNKYGVYDYYFFTGRDQYTISRIDNQYTRGFLNYSLTDAGISPYNYENRGVTNYETDYNQVYTVSTKFLTQEWSDWLEGLFISPETWVIDSNNRWFPINLVSADYTKLNDPRSEKLKSYTVQFKYANPPRTR